MRRAELDPDDSSALGHDPDAAHAPGDEAAVRPRRRGGARPHRGRRVLAVLLALLLVGSLAGLGFYRHLNQNLRTVDLPQEVQGSEGDLEGLPKGVAQNIVLIGTDSRQSAADCKLGGACGDAKLDGDTNADVIMVVHLAADHRAMTVLSIPRDTTIDLPACSGNGKKVAERRDRINGTLNLGIDCTLRSIHQLTGLPITHFAMVDFSGVVSLSDAVGGVDVCVDGNVHDTYSHLKLSKGEHTLKGVAALQFVRSRHGFGDGSDLGRTVAQHLYLSALQRKLESAGTLLNPTKVYRLAEAGTRALTVDTGLDDVTSLAQLAATLGRVPSTSTVFVTLPTQPNPENQNTVVPAPSAQRILTKLQRDEPLAAASPSPSSSRASSGSSASPGSSTPSTNGSSPTTSTPSATRTGNAATDGTAQVSSETTGCAHVSTLKTVELNGVPMTPGEAYDATPNLPDSDA